MAKKGRMRRHAQLPTTFPTFDEYQATLTAAVHECMQVEVTEVATRYWALRREIEGRVAEGSADAERYLRSKGIDAYFGCTLRYAFGGPGVFGWHGVGTVQRPGRSHGTNL